ncbi:MAG: iron ABC transporter permease, partial [Veillonella sp.]|nr:iron ABC transporter permease [Veillonella sp.]
MQGRLANRSLWIAIVLIAVLCGASMLSLYIGARYISVDEIIKSFVNYDSNSIGELLIQTLR